MANENELVLYPPEFPIGAGTITPPGLPEVQPPPRLFFYPIVETGILRVFASYPPRKMPGNLGEERGIYLAGDWHDWTFGLLALPPPRRKPPRDRGWAFADEVYDFYRLDAEASSREGRLDILAPPGAVRELYPSLVANWFAKPIGFGITVGKRIDEGPVQYTLAGAFDVLRYAQLGKPIAWSNASEVNLGELIDTLLSLLNMEGVRVPHYPSPPIYAGSVPVLGKHLYIPGPEEEEEPQNAYDILSGIWEGLEAIGYRITTDGVGRILHVPPPDLPFARLLPGESIPLPEPEPVRVGSPEGSLLVPGGAALDGAVLHMGYTIKHTGQSGEALLYWPDLEIPDEDIYSWEEEEEVSDRPNRIVVINSDFYEMAEANDVAPCVSIGLLGRRTGDLTGPIEINPWPGEQPSCPLVGGDWRTGASEYQGTHQVQASGVPVEGDITVAVEATWYGDQHGDFGGPGVMGRETGMVFAPQNQTTRIELWPSMPGPPLGRRAYLHIDVTPVVNGGLLERIDLSYRASMVYDSLGIPILGGVGNWVYAVLAKLSFASKAWVRSDTRRVKVIDIPEAPSRQRLGVVVKRVEVKGIDIGDGGIAAIASHAAERATAGGGRVRASIRPILGLHHIGRVVKAGGKRWRVASLRYSEEHGNGLSVSQEVVLEGL